MDEPENRFRHESHAASLKSVHLPSSLVDTHLDLELEDSDSHFFNALQLQRQLNLSPAFLRFANATEAKARSLPLLVHNWEEIVQCWIETIPSADDEALRALLDVLSKLIFDLRETLHPAHPKLLQSLLNILTPSISADTLTSLLSTLSSLFKHSFPPSQLEETWNEYRGATRKCNGDIQRAVAGVWGNVLRRLRGGEREKAVGLVVGSLGEDDGVLEAWIFISACKGVASALHSSSPALLTLLLTPYLASSNTEEEERIYILLRRTLTALIHHSSPDQFTLSQTLISAFSPSQDEQQRRRMLRLLTILASVRKGSRLTRTSSSNLSSKKLIKISESDHAKLLALLLDLSRQGGKSKESVELAVSLLCVEGAGVGSKVLDLVGVYLAPSPWPSPPSPPSTISTTSAVAKTTTNGTALALSFAQCLSALQYPHFKSLLRPLLLQNLPKYWEGDKERTIDALCVFWEGGFLGGSEVSDDVRLGMYEWVEDIVVRYEKNGLDGGEGEGVVCSFFSVSFGWGVNGFWFGLV
ncbi:hypothetical protein SISSUDRAFT_176457 [Sistotremastrum suecicum HHB10207 ss-3]|uniref:Uncharacterized protein n=1 Tax=Sistotremastrum suecicum HHB10207 ss-3 TaxID=1314776 RepID=A0A166GPZ7_9AGAM|nr:hypothetical protein SISSUDRAFT_176457 [Sistotremastrum suecicum HHB10207 ss-3]